MECLFYAISEFHGGISRHTAEETAHVRCIFKIQAIGNVRKGQLCVIKIGLHFNDKLLVNQRFRRHSVCTAVYFVKIVGSNYMFISILGEEGVTAFAIACYLFPIVFSISNAVAQAAQPIISFNYGAHQPERVRQTLHVSLFTAVVCGITITLCLWLGATGIVSLFLNPQESAYSMAVEGLPLFALCAVFFAVNITFIGYYQSIENALASTVYTLLRGVIFLEPCFILLPKVILATAYFRACLYNILPRCSIIHKPSICRTL